MNIERVHNMIFFLERVQEEIRIAKKNKTLKVGFNLDGWAGSPRFDIEKTNHCGTTCCAMGHAAIDPYFKKRGLKLIFEYEADNNKKKLNSTGLVEKTIRNADDLLAADKIHKKMSEGYESYFSIKYTDPKTRLNYAEFAAAEKFFGLTDSETAIMLFGPDRYPENNKSIRNVIARLKYLAKHGEKKFLNYYYK